MATAEHLMATEVDWDRLSIFSFQAGGSDHKANLNLVFFFSDVEISL
jgi:hypothetical protein